mmetsp:Transcript_22548/g.21668  ORF Transcript_22548/g.21668 Transcript_22548/m.21668 type:complete len:478 (-) Transcript_22548:152-1585(-)
MSSETADFAVGDAASEFVRDFVIVFEPHGIKTPDGTKMRREAFSSTDGNGSGKVSLAEMETFIAETLKKAYPDEEKGQILFARFRPCYLYAFKNAKNLIPGSGSADDFISFAEFRMFTIYLRIYTAMYDMFVNIDGGDGKDADDDSRIELAEFLKNFESIKGLGFVALEGVNSEDDAKEIFHKIDTNEGGMILFSEWSSFLKKEEIKNNTITGSLLNMKVTKPKVSPKKVTRQKISPGIPVTKKGAKSIAPVKISGAYTPGSAVSSNLLDFINTFRLLAEKTTGGYELRKTAFKSCDGNGSGQSSLAEVDGYIQSALKRKCGNEKGETLYKVFRPCYIVAFGAAKPIANLSKADDDFINFAEFRVLHAYLCIYASMLDAFSLIDGGGAGVDKDDDRRLSKDEWMTGYKNVTDFGFVGLNKMSDDSQAEDIFTKMDSDGKGMVLLKEFCHYLKTCELDAKTPLGPLLSGNLTPYKVSH